MDGYSDISHLSKEIEMCYQLPSGFQLCRALAVMQADIRLCGRPLKSLGEDRSVVRVMGPLRWGEFDLLWAQLIDNIVLLSANQRQICPWC